MSDDKLQGIVCLQRTIINSCHNQTAALEEMVKQLVEVVRKLEETICYCWDQLLSPGPHFAEGENQEIVVDSEEEDDKDGLNYETEEEPLDLSYTTPLSTRGHTPPSPYPSCSPTPEGSDLENNACLQTELIEAWVEAFLAEAEEDLKLYDLPPLENTKPILIQVATMPGFVPFVISTSQHCVPSKGLPHGTYHLYNNSVQG